MPAITIAHRIQSTLVDRVGLLWLAFASAAALTPRLSRNAVEIGSLSGGGVDGDTMGDGISEAKGLELSGICGPSAQFSRRATMRVRSAKALLASPVTQSPISRRVAGRAVGSTAWENSRIVAKRASGERSKAFITTASSSGEMSLRNELGRG